MALSEAAKKARAKALREWRRKNPEKLKAQQERYWERRAEREALEEQESPLYGFCMLSDNREIGDD